MRLGHITIGVGYGFVDHREIVLDGNRVVAELGYVTEYVPGCVEIVGGVKRPISRRDVANILGPVFTRGEPFPYSAAARRIVAALEGGNG
jgi:hypothetical protein